MIIRKKPAGYAKDCISLTDSDAANYYYVGHTIYTEDHAQKITQTNTKGFLMIRDPRDTAVSWIQYCHGPVMGGWGPSVWPFLDLPFDQALSLWISDTSTLYSPHTVGWGNPDIKNFGNLEDFYHHYLMWANHPAFYVVKFEHLVGPKGGGSLNTQLREIKNIAKHIGIHISNIDIRYIAKNLFGNTATFNKGQIGSWKKYFTEKHKRQFKMIIGDLLIQLGYEKDMNW